VLFQPFGKGGVVAITSRVMPIIDATSDSKFRSTGAVISFMDPSHNITSKLRGGAKNTINKMVKMGYFDMNVIGKVVYIKLSSNDTLPNVY